MKTEIRWHSPEELPQIGEKILIVYHLGEPFTQEHDCVIVNLGKSGTIWYDNDDLDDRPCGDIKWEHVTRWVPCAELLTRGDENQKAKAICVRKLHAG